MTDPRLSSNEGRETQPLPRHGLRGLSSLEHTQDKTIKGPLVNTETDQNQGLKVHKCPVKYTKRKILFRPRIIQLFFHYCLFFT